MGSQVNAWGAGNSYGLTYETQRVGVWLESRSSVGWSPGVDAFRSVPKGRKEGRPRLETLGRRRAESRSALTACARQRLAAVLPGRSGTGRGADSFCFRS
jgi:hypothetical protein